MRSLFWVESTDNCVKLLKINSKKKNSPARCFSYNSVPNPELWRSVEHVFCPGPEFNLNFLKVKASVWLPKKSLKSGYNQLRFKSTRKEKDKVEAFQSQV